MLKYKTWKHLLTSSSDIPALRPTTIKLDGFAASISSAQTETEKNIGSIIIWFKRGALLNQVRFECKLYTFTDVNREFYDHFMCFHINANIYTNVRKRSRFHSLIRTRSMESLTAATYFCTTKPCWSRWPSRHRDWSWRPSGTFAASTIRRLREGKTDSPGFEVEAFKF